MGKADVDERSATRTASPSVRLVCDEVAAQGGLEPGVCIDRYQVIEFVGEGGMGKVYRARDTELDREVALKWIDPRRFGATRAQLLLRREAQAMARVEHPAVVRIYDVGVAGEHLFVAMELVRGGPLGAWVHARPRSWREVLRVFGEAGRGIAAAHRAGLVHRDIKPGNILLDDAGRPRISDFGLARTLAGDTGTDIDDDGAPAAARDPSITRTGAVVGTLAYMAPEQLAGDAIDARADQFAFCVSLWEALCGARPFRLDSTAPNSLRALLSAIRAGAIERPLDRPRVPRRVLAVLRRGLAADRAARWPAMDALLAALDEAARPRRRWWVAAGAAAAVATAAVVVRLAGRGDGDAGFPVFGAPRPVAHTDAHGLAMTMLRDGRFVRLDDDGLSVITGDHLARRALAAPPGVSLDALQASAVDGWLEILQYAAPCVWWHAPVDGGAWQRLGEDPTCQRSIAVRPDGAALAITSGNDLRVRDRASGADRVLLESTALRGRAAWSPDGGRLAAVVGDDVVVIDATSGARVARPFRGGPVWWLDRDRLLYVADRTWTRAELHAFDLRGGSHRRVRDLDGEVDMLAVSRDGVLINTVTTTGAAYTAAMPPPHPLTVDEMTLLETGAEIDFIPGAWTADGAVVTLSVAVGRRGLVRTAPGQRGTPIVTHRGDQIMLGGSSRDRLFYRTGDLQRCAQHAYDLSTGLDRVYDERPCSDPLFVRCAAAAARCIGVSPTGARWLDPNTLAFGGPAPRLDIRERLSPDGREIVQIRDQRIIVRAIDTGAETEITLSPPVTMVTGADWGPDAATLLVHSAGAGRDQIRIATRDGRWRLVVDEPTRQLNGPILSPDGHQLAVVATRRSTNWSYLPFVPSSPP